MNLVANAGQRHKEVSLVRFDTESPSASALRCPVGRRRVAIAQMKSSALYAFCLAHGISRSGDNPRLMMSHVLTLATRRSCFLFVLERSPPVCSYSMDTILRLLEGLRRDELVWLNTYLTGRLRAMPPPSAVPAHAGIAGDSVEEVPVAALAERVGDFNISMDPWEQTGAALQGWASHLHQTVIPVQGYVQLRPHDTTLPSFGGGPPATAGTENVTIPTEAAIRGGGGKASPSVSIFSRAPLCPNTCRHCRNKPCDIATDHDDHICDNCEQRLLFPECIPKWETQKLPICDLWCQECATQRCCTRGSHQYHLYACSVNDEELYSSPPLGARTHGLPMMTDWKSLSASCGPLHTDLLCNGE